jgi:hypothetical protein
MAKASIFLSLSLSLFWIFYGSCCWCFSRAVLPWVRVEDRGGKGQKTGFKGLWVLSVVVLLVLFYLLHFTFLINLLNPLTRLKNNIILIYIYIYI